MAINSEFARIEELKKDFEVFEDKDSYILESLLSSLPGKYNYDYMVYAVSKSITEEKEVWELPLYEVIKRFMFKKFDNKIEQDYMEYLRSKRNG